MGLLGRERTRDRSIGYTVYMRPDRNSVLDDPKPLYMIVEVLVDCLALHRTTSYYLSIITRREAESLSGE